jgi:threonine dehydrogenase-like Zn-dependent dehydrogenase
MPHLLEHIRSGRVNAKGIITHRLGLDEAPHAYDIFSGKKEHCLKCVLLPQARA